MEMLDRYLQAVKFFLPRRADQDDIVRELGENLRSQMEDREEALGRPLTDHERADVIRRHGHPMLVAGRYRTHQYLIGAAFFPIYVFALKLGLGAAAIVSIVLTAIDAAMHDDVVPQIVRGLLAYPGRALMVFAWTTLVFAVIDYAQATMKLTHEWDPRSLPKLASPDRHLSRLHSLFECIATGAAMVWLLLVPQFSFLLLGPLAAFLMLTPIWGTVYVPILLAMLATMVLSVTNFVLPVWTPARSYARIAIHGANALIFLTLLRAGEWVALRPDLTVPPDADPARIVTMINTGVKIGLIVAVILAAVEIVKELRRVHAFRRLSTAPGSASTMVL